MIYWKKTKKSVSVHISNIQMLGVETSSFYNGLSLALNEQYIEVKGKKPPQLTTCF